MGVVVAVLARVVVTMVLVRAVPVVLVRAVPVPLVAVTVLSMPCLREPLRPVVRKAGSAPLRAARVDSSSQALVAFRVAGRGDSVERVSL